MDQWQAAAEMHPLLGANERSLSDDLRPCVLLDLRNRVAEGAADVSALPAECACAACVAIARVMKKAGDNLNRLVQLITRFGEVHLRAWKLPVLRGTLHSHERNRSELRLLRPTDCPCFALLW